MKTPLDTQLSAELQELYLENKEWLSTILFLEDEMRFYQNLFNVVLSNRIKKKYIEQVAVISAGLATILARRKTLKVILDLRKAKIEGLLSGVIQTIGLDLIEEDAAIVAEIKSLLVEDQLVRSELFRLIEELKSKEKPMTLLVYFKTNSYPIL